MRCCGKLGLCLFTLDLHLWAKGVIARGKFFWLATHGVILHVYFLSLLVCFWCFWFESNLFLEIQACEVSILVTGLALVFLGWTLESFNMLWITTFRTPIFAYMSLFGIKPSFVWWGLLLTCGSLVTLWSWLKGFPRAFACWEVCLLVSHQIDVSCLGIICYLLDVPCSCFGSFHLLCKLPDLAWRELVKVNTAVIDGLWYKLIL